MPPPRHGGEEFQRDLFVAYKTSEMKEVARERMSSSSSEEQSREQGGDGRLSSANEGYEGSDRVQGLPQCDVQVGLVLFAYQFLLLGLNY